MNPILNEWRVFKHAIVFFTQIPLSKSFQYSESYAKKAIKYLPLIGSIVGIFVATIIFLCNMIFPIEISVFFSILASILATGAIHEDGFADFCDSLGGMTVEKKLSIMKDSNIGAFGVIGLVSILLGKYLFLIHIPSSQIPVVLISGHIISRFSIMFIIIFLPYTGKKNLSKSITMVENKHLFNIFIGFILTGIFYSLMPSYITFSIPIIIITIILICIYYKKSIKGYTGDYLGAAQQVTEVTHYLFFVYWLA